jgi:hypothetical protein
MSMSMKQNKNIKMAFYETIESLTVLNFLRLTFMLLTLWSDLQTSVLVWFLGESDQSRIEALEIEFQHWSTSIITSVFLGQGIKSIQLKQNSFKDNLEFRLSLWSEYSFFFVLGFLHCAN